MVMFRNEAVELTQMRRCLRVRETKPRLLSFSKSVSFFFFFSVGSFTYFHYNSISLSDNPMQNFKPNLHYVTLKEHEVALHHYIVFLFATCFV